MVIAILFRPGVLQSFFFITTFLACSLHERNRFDQKFSKDFLLRALLHPDPANVSPVP